MRTIEMITSADETTYERVIRNGNLETSYSVSDFVGDYQVNYKKTYVVLNAGYVLAVVFGEQSEDDALDAAVDAGKLDGLLLAEDELKDYETGQRTDVGSEHCPEGYPEYEGVINLGNASEPFASESLDVWTVPIKHFAEDPALMTLERVQERIEDMESDAERDYRKVDVHDPAWQTAYQRSRDLKDARSVCFYAGRR